MSDYQRRDEYIQTMIQHGHSLEEAIAAADKIDREVQDLRNMICPDCGSMTNLTRKVDPRQAGYHASPGVWYNYRCSCGYLADTKEPLDEKN